MLQQIENISQQAMVALRNASSEEELQKISRQYMGKNGELTTVLKGQGLRARSEKNHRAGSK